MKVEELDDASRKALYINVSPHRMVAHFYTSPSQAYNVFTIKMIVDNKCGGALCTSIENITSGSESVWKLPAGNSEFCDLHLDASTSDRFAHA